MPRANTRGFFLVRPAGRTHSKVKVLYTADMGKCWRKATVSRVTGSRKYAVRKALARRTGSGYRHTIRWIRWKYRIPAPTLKHPEEPTGAETRGATGSPDYKYISGVNKIVVNMTNKSKLKGGWQGALK
jgi:hypothetical protein